MHIDKTKNFVKELELEQESPLISEDTHHPHSQVVNYWSAMKKIQSRGFHKGNGEHLPHFNAGDFEVLSAQVLF